MDQAGRAKDIFNVLRKKKFVMLLDDIWETLDLQDIGIPPLDTGSSSTQGSMSKVVFTTRSEVVCGSMGANRKISVKCLESDEAWNLFKTKVGQEVLDSDPKIPKLAEIVAKECQGLPLALITIGRAMATKKTAQEWEHAITILKRSASDFSGMGDNVFSILKYSYDNLENDKLKSCFLYCSLYPEDYEIERKELIDVWIGEGFLTDFDDIEKSRNEGHYVIGCLLGASLLEYIVDEETKVKMHDVIRDLAIWVASECGRKKGKFLVVQSDKLKLDEWEKAERISLIDNHDIYELSEAPSCINLSTLLLQHSNLINGISDGFFQIMPKLKVLSMRLRDDDVYQMQLPELEYLKVSGPEIIFNSGWLKSLVKLKYLDLSETSNAIIKINSGEIACLSKLQMLDLCGSDITDWDVEGKPSLAELEGLVNLNYLGITIGTGRCLEKLVSNRKLQLCTRRLFIKEDMPFQIIMEDLQDGPCITSLALSPSSTSLSLANMINLKELSLSHCYKLEELRINWPAAEDDKNIGVLRTLEKLYVFFLPNLKIVGDIILQQPHHHQFCYFTNLQDVEIYYCPALKNVTWLLIYARVLERLRLEKMDGLKEVISDHVFAPPPMELVDENYYNTIFSRLKTLELYQLGNLESICVRPLAFPCLKLIRVVGCPKLKKLPLSTNSVKNNTVRMIVGKRKWWESLEWEDESIKSSFLPFFVQRNEMVWFSCHPEEAAEKLKV